MPQKNSSRWPKTGGHVNIQPGFEFFFKSSMGTPFLKDVNTPTYTQIKPMCVASLTQIQSNTEAYFSVIGEKTNKINVNLCFCNALKMKKVKKT